MRLSKGILGADGLLLVTAMIWGFAFAAQRSGMRHMGPFAYSAARFALGTLSLLPLLALQKRRRPAAPSTRPPRAARAAWIALAGLALFLGANFQQLGLVRTTAANAGFITTLYVILVPLAGLFLGRSPGARAWAGAVLAAAGLCVLGVQEGFTMAPGDLLELVGALFWTVHILLINRLVTRMDALEIAVGQVATCSILSLAVALAREPAPFRGLGPAAIPVLVGGLLSIGVAYTLQIIAQKTARPAHASIILSMEALFAGIGGVLFLREPLTGRLVGGGLLMLAGMALSQSGAGAVHAGEDHDGLASSMVEAACDPPR